MKAQTRIRDLCLNSSISYTSKTILTYISSEKLNVLSISKKIVIPYAEKNKIYNIINKELRLS